MAKTQSPPPRIQIQELWPLLDCGRYPPKRSVGDEFRLWATIFRDGHEILGAALRYRHAAERRWREAPMHPVGNDRWTGTFTPDRCGRWLYTIEAWSDRRATWLDELRRKVEAGAGGPAGGG